MQIIKNFSLLILLLAMSACSHTSKKNPTDNVALLSPEELYEKAIKSLDQRQYNHAIENFAKIQEEYPFSPFATKSQLKEAYAYYLKHDHDHALIILDDFIKMHPANDEVADAYYLKAMSLYSLIEKVERDQHNTEETRIALNEVIIRFPNSKYAAHAKSMLNLVYDHLAGKEMCIGRYYLFKNNLGAALPRFHNVVEKYQKTIHIEEALYRLIEIYLSLGLADEANKFITILGYNYPKSKWFRYATSLPNLKKQHNK